ncbi:MAG: RidA family protein [Gammaproteobacteria bacterium]|nr:MAG: RidA family protein [Gammaproteobacteria bacterium]
MNKEEIKTIGAPEAIGTYSQAIRCGDMVYLSGQIAINPQTGETVTDSVATEIHQIISNLSAVAKAAGGTLDHIIKLNVYMTNLNDFATLNEIMQEYFTTPYPARAAVGVAQLPKGVSVEIEGIMALQPL